MDLEEPNFDLGLEMCQSDDEIAQMTFIIPEELLIIYSRSLSVRCWLK